MSFKKSVAAVLSSLSYRIFSFLPLLVKARVLDKIAITVGLDYKDNILLSVDSYWSYYRRGSCAKEPDTVRWLEFNLKSGDVFYDIGANIGAYSFVAASLIQDGVVVSIEPSFSTYKTLCSNVILNKSKFNGVEFYPFGCAVGDKNSYLNFKYSEISSGAAQHGSENYETALNVPCITLDDFVRMFKVPPPTVMKIDVDGPEALVLLGSELVLGNHLLRTVLIEVEDCTEDEVKRIMATHNFMPLSFTKKGKWANVVFSRLN